ncbi:hypothetical protein AWB83_03704 [Caballeronia ptereochthonis]|uniref:Lipoprotein n=1 Tax=Caballeronia ptereochthonis TaxID=1777144 RepID=A0A158BW69_9BURK|nr:hypothetical protein AWB83_03704 [Caballeronia ptereochthonis]
MKPLKFFVAAWMLSGASLVLAQTQPDGASAPQAASSSSAPRPTQECVGPASFCNIYFGS